VIPYFPGWISDRSKLASLFLNSDLFWFASIKEGMGNVVIESLLYGTPVVTLPVCGIMREIITCPDEGEVVDDEASPEFFAERVNHYLYERRHDRQALISRARERFDPRKVEEKYIDLFTRLAGVRCF
jgi:glycosyltransferase involved in cell wall biosynthesis